MNKELEQLLIEELQARKLERIQTQEFDKIRRQLLIAELDRYIEINKFNLGNFLLVLGITGLIAGIVIYFNI